MSIEIINKANLKIDKQLIIRKPKIEEAEMIIKYLNIVSEESDNLLFGKNEFHLSIEQEQEYIRNFNNNVNALMILGTIDNEIVSIAQISSPSRKRISHNSELAISVKKQYWHNGIGSAMMEELLNFARKSSKNVSLGVKASNKNAIMLYEKFGFQKVGLHKNYFNINGNFDDKILMDLYL